MSKQHPLIGSWVNGDEYATEVEYVVSGKEPRFQVQVVDRYDGEVGEVRDVSYDDRTSTLSFAVYWTSTGRFIKVRVIAISPNRVSYTYTFTENQMWFRKGTEPGASPSRRPARRRAVQTPRRSGGR
jgi:regulation of enolase protein 1 (concanavalin A-like superfamily)